MEPKRLSLRPYAKAPELDLQSMTEDYLTYGHRIAQYVADTARLTWDVLDTRRQRALRGRAGHAAGHRPRHVSVRDLVEPGLRLRLHRHRRRARRTSTRSGASPRPTPRASAPARSRPSSTTSSAITLREAGGEYGTTTGRARRVGWVDLVALRYAARINSLTHLAITKLDVLTGLGDLNVCTRYRGAEEATFDHYPYHQTVMHQAAGEYEQLPGWDEDITECRDERDLPQNARDYLQYISDFVGVPIALIGVGPGRDQVIWTEAGRESLAARPPRSPA